MFKKLVMVASPERLRCAKALQRKLLGLISTARIDFLTAETHQETKLCFKWVFQSSEYDGFPSKPKELDDIYPLPRKIAIKWPLEEIDRCANAIDRGFVKIIAYPRSRSWNSIELHRSLRSRIYDFTESSLGRRLLPRANNFSPISNDEVNFYRWEFGQGYPGFLSSSFSLWPQEKYLELIKALDSGALKIVTDVAAGQRDADINNTDLMKLCNQAWIILESQDRANGVEHNMGLSYAIQLKDQIQIANTLEDENYNLKVQILQLKHSQESLQQQSSSTQENHKKDISNARLEGEKIAENYVKRLFYSAREQGRVLGVYAIEARYLKEGFPSTFANQARLNPSSRPSDPPSSVISGSQVLSNTPKKIPSMCADETRSHLPKATVPYTPPQSGPTSPAYAISALSTGLLQAISDLETHHSHYQTPVTNASVQIPSTTRGFHKSFLNEVLGPMHYTLNIIPTSRIPNSVKWTEFFTIHLDTQPYIFPLPSPLQTYGQIVHFISQSTTETLRATQGTTFPVLLRLSPDVDQYYYIGHFVVSNVFTTTDFDQVLNNLPENDENTKRTKHKLLKERDRALGSAATITRNMPVDFYTLQYVFFGEEQYKILVGAQEKFEALGSANNTINLLLEPHINHTESASPPLTHQTTLTKPMTMTRKPPRVPGFESHLDIKNHSTTSQYTCFSKVLNEPSSILRKLPSHTENANMPKSKEYDTMSPFIPRANESLPHGPAPVSTGQSSDAKNKSLSDPNRHNVITPSTPTPISNKSRDEYSTTKRKLPFGDNTRRKKKNGRDSMDVNRIREF